MQVLTDGRNGERQGESGERERAETGHRIDPPPTPAVGGLTRRRLGSVRDVIDHLHVESKTALTPRART
jgi:hypothetical protein